MKNRWLIRVGCVAAVVLLSMTCVAGAGNVGSEADPLVTYSYVNETFKNEVISDANGGFVLVTLNKGQVLNGEIGTEVLLRVGTAQCMAKSSPGLIDTTDASTINDGTALKKNHLYMMTIEDRGVKATASTVKVLVRGSYTVSQ